MPYPYTYDFPYANDLQGERPLAEGPYQTFHQQIAPPWLRKPKGRALWRAYGTLKDQLLDRLRESSLARFPDYAPADGLALIGAQRQIDRGLSEGSASYASRLKKAWTTWHYAGTATGILAALYYAGYPAVELIAKMGKRYRFNPATGLAYVSHDQAAGYTLTTVSLPQNFWNTFLVFFYSLPTQWNGTIIPPVSKEAKNIRRLVRKWKPTVAVCAGYLFPDTNGLYCGAQGVKLGDPGVKVGHGVNRWSPNDVASWGGFSYDDGFTDWG